MADEKRSEGKAALYRQYEDALFRVALMEIELEDIEALENEACDYAPDANARARVWRAIDRAAHRRKLARFSKRTLPRMVTGAACLVLVCFAGLTTVLATSERAREQVLGLIINIKKGETQLSLAPVAAREAPLEAPEGWRGLYYPAYMPKGYRFDSVFADGTMVFYEHHRGGNSISFSENDENSSVGIESYDAQVRYLTIHGHRALLSVSPSSSFISWSEQERFFVVDISSDDEQTLIRVADSVRRLSAEGGDMR